MHMAYESGIQSEQKCKPVLEVSVTGLQGPGRKHKGVEQAGETHVGHWMRGGGHGAVQSACPPKGASTTQYQAHGRGAQCCQVFKLFRSSWRYGFLCEVLMS